MGIKEALGDVAAVLRRKRVYAVLDGERAYQAKWDTAESKGLHEPAAFILFMEHYLAEARKLESTVESGGNGTHVEGSLDFVRKVTALGVACMEQHGAPERKPSRQFVTKEEHGTLVSMPVSIPLEGKLCRRCGKRLSSSQARANDYCSAICASLSSRVTGKVPREVPVEGIVDAGKDLRTREVWIEYGAPKGEDMHFLKMSYGAASKLYRFLRGIELRCSQCTGDLKVTGCDMDACYFKAPDEVR